MTTYIENTKEISKNLIIKDMNYVTFADGVKGVLYLVNDVWCKRVVIEEEGITGAHVIIKGVSELLNMHPSGNDEYFCNSFYKNANNLKYRVSNHQTTSKWGVLKGYADINIIIFNGKSKKEVELELKEVNLTISECLEAGNKAFEEMEHERRMRMTF